MLSLQGVHNFWHVLAQCVQCSHSSRMPAVEALCMPACVVLGYNVAIYYGTVVYDSTYGHDDYIIEFLDS